MKKLFGLSLIVVATSLIISCGSDSQKTFTITWKNDDGRILEIDSNVFYGEYPTYDSKTPSKESSLMYDYEFNGWSPSLTSVSSDCTYTAQYEQKLREYTIIFRNYDNSILNTATFHYGDFPQYEGETPVKESDFDFYYTFSGWEPALEYVTEDYEYQAKFDRNRIYYTVTYLNYDGTILAVDSFASGDFPNYDHPETDISKPSDEHYDYVFVGWDHQLEPVTSDATYTAVFEAKPKTFTATFVNYDGTVLYSTNCVYGTTPEYQGFNPTRPSSESTKYTFKGWSPQIGPIQGDTTYTAIYDDSVRYYDVYWKNGNYILYNESYPYGATPEYHGETPTKDSTEYSVYTFTGWSPEIEQVTRNISYYAVFEKSVRYYTITWQNYDGTPLEVDKCQYGEHPTYDSPTPIRESSASTDYTFTGWSSSIYPVTRDMIYVAQYKESIRNYKIVFKNYDGTVLQERTYEYGAMPAYYSETPYRPDDDLTDYKYYEFVGWDKEINTVVGDTIYTAVFKYTDIYVYEENEDHSSYCLKECKDKNILTFNIPTKYRGINITSIGDRAFENCTKLTSINVPDSITKIGEKAFIGCDSIVDATLPFVGEQSYQSEISKKSMFGYIFGGSTYSSVTSCYNFVPPYFRSVKITGGKHIYDCAFKNLVDKNYSQVPITDIELPDSIFEIGKHAFYGLNYLKNINLPETINYIEEYAFYRCSSVNDIHVPSNTIRIGQYAFYNTVKKFVVPSTTSTIGDYAFYGAEVVKCVVSFGTYSWSSNWNAGVKEVMYGFRGDFEQDDFVYSLYSNNELRIDKYTGTEEDLTLPSGAYIDGEYHEITTIGAYAFYANEYLKKLTIPQGITRIYQYAFYSCTKLCVVNIPASVYYIGANAFYYANDAVLFIDRDKIPSNWDEWNRSYDYSNITLEYYLNEYSPIFNDDFVLAKRSEDSKYVLAKYLGDKIDITLNSDLQISRIGKYAFTNTKLESVNLSFDSSVSIDDRAFFKNESLRHLTLRGVNKIGSFAFTYCSNLRNVTIPSEVVIMGDYVFHSNTYKYCAVSEKPDGWSTTWSINHAFWACDGFYVDDNELQYTLYSDLTASVNAYFGSEKDVVVPDNVTNNNQIYTVTSIYDLAFFSRSKLESVELPNSINTVGYRAFYSCKKLKSVELGSGNKTINEGAFSGCSLLSNVHSSNSVIGLGKYAFSDCYELKSFSFNNEIASIGYGSFSNCHSLSLVSLPNSLKTVEDYAFYTCIGIETLDLGNSVETLSKYSFRGCSKINELVIPDSVLLIDDYCFSECYKIEKLTIGCSVKTIGTRAFYDCHSFKSLVIPASVTNIGEEAFMLCDSIESIEMPSLNMGKLFGKSGDVVRLPKALKTVTITSGILYSNTFDGCSGIEIYIKDNVKLIFSVDVYSMNPTAIFFEATKDSYEYAHLFDNIDYPVYWFCSFLYSDETFDYIICPDDTAIISGYHGDSRDVIIPEKIMIDEKSYVVTGINDNVFSYSVDNVYYCGNDISNFSIGENNFPLISLYLFSETDLGVGYWRYVDGIPTKW